MLNKLKHIFPQHILLTIYKLLFNTTSFHNYMDYTYKSINNRKQTIKKTTIQNVQIKLEHEWEVGVGDDLYS